MSTYVALLRAINVAGNSILKMSEVRKVFASAGCSNVRAFIQSGNVIFEAAAGDVAQRLQDVRRKLRNRLGAEPEIFLRSARQIEGIVDRAPFRDAKPDSDVKWLVTFLNQKARARKKLPLHSSREPVEVIAMTDREAYVVSRRKKNGFFGFPNEFVEKEMGVSATTRSWSTVTKIFKLLQDRT